MTVFFALIDDGNGEQPAFFLREQDAPRKAVRITERRHRELLEALEEGRGICADDSGKPKIEPLRFSPSAKREELASAIRREAARRIALISPLWRQLNDTREPSPDGALRFDRIDAVRVASNQIENELDDLNEAQLSAFSVVEHHAWPLD